MTKIETQVPGPRKRNHPELSHGVRGSAAPRNKSGRAILVDRLAVYKAPAAGWYRVSFFVNAPNMEAILNVFRPEIAKFLSFTAGTKKRKP